MYREGSHVNIVKELEEMLGRESFPPNNEDQYYELPPAGYVQTHVTEQAVERALYSQSVNIAPDPEKHSFGAIRRL